MEASFPAKITNFYPRKLPAIRYAFTDCESIAIAYYIYNIISDLNKQHVHEFIVCMQSVQEALILSVMKLTFNSSCGNTCLPTYQNNPGLDNEAFINYCTVLRHALLLQQLATLHMALIKTL